jgi:hypothetical protein
MPDMGPRIPMHPLALQRRNLQSLVELGVDKNTTVVPSTWILRGSGSGCTTSEPACTTSHRAASCSSRDDCSTPG